MDVQGNPFIKLDCCTKASWFLVTPDSTLREHLVGRGSEKKLQETGFHGGDVCIPTNGGGGLGNTVIQLCSMELLKLVLCSTAKEYVVPSIPSYNLLFSR